MSNNTDFKYEDPQFSEDVAYVELGPKDKKPPRNIPTLKILVTIIALFFLVSLLLLGVFLIFNPNRYEGYIKSAETKFQAVIDNYDSPRVNSCGEEAKICMSGKVVVKTGVKCEYATCPTATGDDITRFWNVRNSQEKFIRTFMNLDLHYEFDLPKNWEFLGRDFGFVIFSPNYTCNQLSIIAKNNACEGTIIELNSSNTTAKNDVKDWYNSNENYFLLNSDIKTPISIKEIEIAGEITIEAQVTPTNFTYYFINDNTVFAFKLVSASKIDLENSMPVMKKILNSFEFTNN